MERFYDLIETPKTGKVFSKAGENRVAESDPLVKNWFSPLPDGKRRTFTKDGLPVFEDIPAVELSPEQKRTEAQANGEVYTLNGEDYRVPFMKDDADGLMQVDAAFQLGVTDTVIYFTNGVKMPITAAEFQDFATWFVVKRNSFFTL